MSTTNEICTCTRIKKCEACGAAPDIYRQHAMNFKDLDYFNAFNMHADRMTLEDLHSKADIAHELAARDLEIKRLEEVIIATENQEPYWLGI